MTETTNDDIIKKITENFTDEKRTILLVLLSVGDHESGQSETWELLRHLYAKAKDELFINYCNELYNANRNPIESAMEGSVVSEDNNKIVIQFHSSFSKFGAVVIRGSWMLARTESNAMMACLRGTATKTAVLVAAMLAYDVFINLKRFYNREITGDQAAKYIVDAVMGCGGVIGGAAGGAAIGALAGPAGAVVGGLVGSIVGGIVVETFSSWLTCQIFNLDPDEAVEKAYRYFGLRRNASADDLNKAYRQLCLQHHPDKATGNQQKFQEVQLMFGLIKVSRGEDNIAP